MILLQLLYVKSIKTTKDHVGMRMIS